MVPIPKGVRPIATRFVYATKDPVAQEVKKAKRGKKGRKAERMAKARLTMKDIKRGGDNLRETFAPTGQTATFRWLMMIAMVLQLLCDHVDVNTAFLYANLTHPMYITGAPGRLCPAGYCLKVVKALYGCREAPREWYHCLRDEIVDNMGFIQSALDPCLFFRFPGLPTIQIIYIYVDDILVFCADRIILDGLKAKIRARFAIKDLGAVKRYLGVWVDMKPDFSGLFLHQTDYCIKVLETFKDWFSMFLTPRLTPLPASFHELIAAETEPIDPSDLNYAWLIMFPYLQIIGALLYLATNTRPDIMFAVCLLARYSKTRQQAACRGVAHLLSYLSGTVGMGIRYTIDPSMLGKAMQLILDIYGMSDADWASCLKTRRSTFGWLVFALGGVIAWGSKLMATIAASSMESEYMSAYHRGQQLLWYRGLMKEIGYPITKPTPFFMDAAVALYAIRDPALRTRSKHIDVKIKWLLMHYLKCFIFIHVRTEDMTADLLTKPSALRVWVELIGHLMGVDIRGSVQLQLAQERAKNTPFPKRQRLLE
jgi:hypothetical protein